MKLLVAIKRVVDFSIKIRVKPDGSAVDTANVKMSINPFDEIAVEEAVKLKEKGIASEIVVVSIGNAATQDTLRQALALGADRGILVQTDDLLESLSVAKVLKTIVEEEAPQLVILGKQAIDDDCNQTGQMLAALLDYPQGTFISELNIEGQKATTVREVDSGLEKISFNLPAVVTTDLRLNTPRYATLPNIMKAKQKPLKVVELASLGVDVKNHLQVVKVAEPAVRKAGKKVNSVGEIVEQIRKVV